MASVHTRVVRACVDRSEPVDLYVASEESVRPFVIQWWNATRRTFSVWHLADPMRAFRTRCGRRFGLRRNVALPVQQAVTCKDCLPYCG